MSIKKKIADIISIYIRYICLLLKATIISPYYEKREADLREVELGKSFDKSGDLRVFSKDSRQDINDIEVVRAAGHNGAVDQDECHASRKKWQ